MRIRLTLAASTLVALISLAPRATAQSYQTELVPDDAAVYDRFGNSVAMDGNAIIVGCRSSDGDFQVYNSGAAYVFREGGSGWIQEAKLLPSDPVTNGNFGESVAIQGNIAVVGAPKAHTLGYPNGVIYVFEFNGTSWQQVARRAPGDALLDIVWDDRFGMSVDIFGETIVAGSPLEDDGAQDAGCAYVFQRAGGAWVERAKLLASDLGTGHRFGEAVSIFGGTIAIGAPHQEDIGDPKLCGALYIFEGGGLTWQQAAKLKGSQSNLSQRLGSSIDLQDGVLVCGAPLDTQDGTYCGSAYVFEGSAGSWTETFLLTETDGSTYDYFGSSVSIRGDRIVVGSYGLDEISPDGGQAFLYGRVGSNWLQIARLHADLTGNLDNQGYGVAISDTQLVSGAPGDSDNHAEGGSVSVWSLATMPQHTLFCFGINCPCGNNDHEAGCARSTGVGALLQPRGSLSLAKDDLEITVENLPPQEFAVLVIGAGQTSMVFGDGRLCIDTSTSAGGYHFLGRPALTGTDGFLTVGPGALQTDPSLTPGSTRYFQSWYRDRHGLCGSFNTSNAMALTFIP